MPVHPFKMASTPEGRVLEAVGDLQREVRQLREARAGQEQHFAYNYSTGGPWNGTSGAPSLLTPAGELTIPTEDHRLIYRMEWRQASLSNSTSSWSFGLQVTDANDVAFRNRVGTIDNNAAQQNVGTYTPTFVSGGATMDQIHNVAFFEGPWPGAVTGPATVQPYAYRTAGTATMTVSFVYLWVAVL